MTIVIADPCSVVDATPAAVQRLVRGCSPRSLQQRFLHPVPLDPEVAWARSAHFLLAGPPRGSAVLATTGIEPLGLLNLVVTGDRTAEAALLVADAHQRSGVGTRMVRAELRRPRWAGWTIHATFAPGNTASRALLRGLDLGPVRLVDRDPSALEVALTLRADEAA